MNQVLLATTGDLVDTVFARIEVRSISTDAAGAGGGLKSGALDAFEAAISEKLQELRDLAGRAVRNGWDAVQGAARDFSASVDEVAAGFGKRAQEFRDRLMALIRQIISDTFDFMLSAMRSELKIGNRTYTMASVDIEQRLVFTSSIDISVTSLCKLLGTGELVVKGKYAIPDAALVQLAAP